MGNAKLASSRESSRLKNRQHAEDRAEDLMRAALHLFATKDFGRITLRDIQRASGFDAALIYYYFKNKQDLFDATVRFALGEAAGVNHLARSADADPVQVIRNWLQHSLNMAEYNCTILRIMMHYAGSKRGGALEESMQKFYQREEMDILAESVRRGIASKLFRQVDPVALARYVSVHLDGITAASMVRRKFDVVAAFRDLEASIWLQLNYNPKGLKSLEGRLQATQPRRATRSSIGR
jgi:AcrR family transcriptional regulator